MSSSHTLTLHAPDPGSVRLVECSPPSWMVALALEEKGLALELRTIS